MRTLIHWTASLAFVCSVARTYGVEVSHSERDSISSLPIASLNQPVALVNASVVLSGGLISLGETTVPMSESRLLNHEELSQTLPVVVGKEVCPLKVESGNWLDLWKAAELLSVPAGASLSVTFAIKAPTSDRPTYLSFGSFEEAIIYQDGIPIYGTIGPRSLSPNEDIVRLKPFISTTAIQIVCRQSKAWSKIPAQHYCSNWALEACVYDSAEAAAASRVSFYTVTTPICDDIRNVRFNAVPDGPVQLCRPDGTVVANGFAGADGVVSWHRSQNELGDDLTQGIYVIRLVGGACDPILITKNVDAYCQAVLREPLGQRIPFWDDRLDHLLKPTFKERRDLWWKRKVLASLSMRALNAQSGAEPVLLRACKSLQIKSLAYESKVDGTLQYFHLYVPSRRPLVSTVIVTPTAVDPIRPPLESVRAAEVWEAQMIAGVAEEFGIAIVLPLFVDVDRGGPLAQKEFKQVLDEAIKHEPRIGDHGIVPVGVCGGGIGAMRLAQFDPRISAIVLDSPEVFRDRTRVALPESITDPVNPYSELEFENSLKALASVPLYVMFDSDLPGHGDRAGTARLITELRAFGGKVKAVWPPIIDEYVWGERDRSRYRTWFEWVASVADSRRGMNRTSESSVTAEASALTIQSALLQGFNVADTVDPLFADFRKRWFAKLSTYRGAEPLRNVTAATTRVVFERRSSFEKPAEGASGKVVTSHDPEFSIRLKRTSDGYEVIVCGTDVPDDINLPSIDMLTEGLYRDITWRYLSHSWQLSSTGENSGPH